jgi:hypothetical protein
MGSSPSSALSAAARRRRGWRVYLPAGTAGSGFMGILRAHEEQTRMRRHAMSDDRRIGEAFRDVHTPWPVGCAREFAWRCRADAAKQGFRRLKPE